MFVHQHFTFEPVGHLHLGKLAFGLVVAGLILAGVAVPIGQGIQHTVCVLIWNCNCDICDGTPSFLFVKELFHCAERTQIQKKDAVCTH